MDTICLECPYQYISVNEDERGGGNPGHPGVKHLQKTHSIRERKNTIPAKTMLKERLQTAANESQRTGSCTRQMEHAPFARRTKSLLLINR